MKEKGSRKTVNACLDSGSGLAGKSLKRDRQSVFFTAVNRCSPVKIWKMFNTMWTNPELRFPKILGGFTKVQ